MTKVSVHEEAFEAIRRGDRRFVVLPDRLTLCIGDAIEIRTADHERSIRVVVTHLERAGARGRIIASITR